MSASLELNAVQQAAVDHITALARSVAPEACRQLAEYLRAAGLSVSPDDLVRGLRNRARVTVNFHPDRLLADGSSVAERLLQDGEYRSQFSTGISNGGLTAFNGGDRDIWERRLFGGAYQAAGATIADRPVYGAADIHGFPDGAALRFGSCHLTLDPEVLKRTTLSAGDSVAQPTILSSYSELRPLLAVLLNRAAHEGVVVGMGDMTVSSLIATLTDSGPRRLRNEAGRTMDDYLEAHVHGGINLKRDVRAITVDPSFQGTVIERHFERLASTTNTELRWHQGFAIAAEEVDAELRGPEIPVIARRVAEFGSGDGLIDAALIGRAAASVNTEPSRWVDLGTAPEVLQQLKKLWHVVALTGHPT